MYKINKLNRILESCFIFVYFVCMYNIKLMLQVEILCQSVGMFVTSSHVKYRADLNGINSTTK